MQFRSPASNASDADHQASFATGLRPGNRNVSAVVVRPSTGHVHARKAGPVKR